jgi:hypothetical protein
MEHTRCCLRSILINPTQSDQVAGFVPVAQDWHGKQTLVVCTGLSLHDKLSVSDAGTIAQLKASCCPTVPDEPYGKMNDWEPFLRAMTIAHLVAAARQFWGMPEQMPVEDDTDGEQKSGQHDDADGEKENADVPLATVADKPTTNWDPPHSKSPDSVKKEWFYGKLGEFIDYHVPARPFPPDIPEDAGAKKKKKKKRSGKSVHGKVNRAERQAREKSSVIDGVFNYASQVLWWGLFFLTWDDSVHEADGDRVIRNWTVALPLYHAWGRTHYGPEAFRLLTDMMTESPEMIERIKHVRFFNTTGGEGNNCSLDLHNEHVNKLIKQQIQRSGDHWDPTKADLDMIGVQARLLTEISDGYNIRHGIYTNNRHTDSKTMRIARKMTTQLTTAGVWREQLGRHHGVFRNIDASPFESLDTERYRDWMRMKRSDLVGERAHVEWAREANAKRRSNNTH